MERTRTPDPSPARRCDDIVDLIDAVLAQYAAADASPARRPPDSRPVLTGSR